MRLTRKTYHHLKSGLDLLKRAFGWVVSRWIKPIFKWVMSSAQGLYHLTVIAATVTAGIWTYALFIRERVSNAHLFMDVKPTIVTNIPALGDRRLIYLDVFLNNTGKRNIVAEKISTNEVAFNDPGETIKYSCGIQVREILTTLIQTNKDISWFADTNLLRCPSGLPPEIDLLEECELPDGTPDFWIEPTDQCHLGHTLVLNKGDYLIKLHFIGTDTNEQFWSHILYMQVN
jgi:hypothetical protein